MEKEEKMDEEKKPNNPSLSPEEERPRKNSDQEMDHETIQILLDDRISTGG
jgi:hypothetical protein